MGRLPGQILALLSLFFPVIAVFSVHRFGTEATVAGLCVLLVLRLAFPAQRGFPLLLIVTGFFVLATVVVVGLVDSGLAVRLYPVLMNAAMLAAFAGSLYRPPSMIERFARMVEPDLDAAGIDYTRKVTIAWILFFAVNGLIALGTVVYGDWALWGLYNGFVAYVAAALLFAGEYVVRRHVRRKEA